MSDRHNIKGDENLDSALNMNAKLVIVLACATLALGGVRKLTGPQLFRTTGKIVGGSPAAAGEIPWQVSLQYTDGFPFCGGFIISEEWIVTAAHCSDQVPSQVRVIVGTLENARPGQTLNVAEIVSNPAYNPSTSSGDIAVWRVDSPITWNSDTQPATLASSTPSTGTLTTVSGWGTTSFGGSASDVLLKVDVPIFDYAECDSIYSIYGGVPADQICAGVPEGGVDSCQGDSGGPLFLAGGGDVVGVVSWGNGCAFAGFPGVYTDVWSNRDFISSTTGV
ncbi:trypsin alpha-3-like [Cloeon dipterum]|uniref:trypsin alpha-3-like n=1 Tax=Cloeon dipterum TaxID=197152 RepID=UPI00321FD478